MENSLQVEAIKSVEWFIHAIFKRCVYECLATCVKQYFLRSYPFGVLSVFFYYSFNVGCFHIECYIMLHVLCCKFLMFNVLFSFYKESIWIAWWMSHSLPAQILMLHNVHCSPNVFISFSHSLPFIVIFSPHSHF